MRMIEDTELLRRYTRDASEEAFAELVRRHVNWVYATACRLAGSASRAEDVTQSVFIDLSRKSRLLTGRREPLGWLHTSTRYASAALRRTEARREHREQTAEDYMDRGDGMSSHDWSRVRPVIDEALAELSAADREVVLRRYFHGQSFPELAHTLGLSEEAARKRATRGLDKIRGRLAKRGITSALAALELALSAQAAVVAPAHLAVSVTAGAVAAGSASLVSLWAAPLAIGAAALVALSTAISVTVRAQAHAAHVERELLSAQRQVSETEIARLRTAQDLAAVRREHAELEREIAEGKARLLEVCSRRGDAALGAKRADGILEAVSILDEMRPFLRQFADAFFDSIHGPLIRKLKLSGQDEIQLKEQLYPTIAVDQAPELKFILNHDGSTRFAVSLKSSGTYTLDEKALEAFLGEERYAIYQDYDRTKPIRMAVVDRLASQLVFSDDPLRATQADRLLDILAASTPDAEMPVPSEIDWDKVLSQAATVLTRPQVEMLARLSGNVSNSWKMEFYGF
jgi:RNA polymerase sigma factor (sigma-70 family)